MQKVALFPFNGEMTCFVHVLLNALDMKAKGFEVGVVVEGAAVKLLPELEKDSNSMHGLYAKVKEQGLFFGVCKACSRMLGVLEGVTATGLPLLDDMQGHAGMAPYMEKGYEIITF